MSAGGPPTGDGGGGGGGSFAGPITTERQVVDQPADDLVRDRLEDMRSVVRAGGIERLPHLLGRERAIVRRMISLSVDPGSAPFRFRWKRFPNRPGGCFGFAGFSGGSFFSVGCLRGRAIATLLSGACACDGDTGAGLASGGECGSRPPPLAAGGDAARMPVSDSPATIAHSNAPL